MEREASLELGRVFGQSHTDVRLHEGDILASTKRDDGSYAACANLCRMLSTAATKTGLA